MQNFRGNRHSCVSHEAPYTYPFLKHPCPCVSLFWQSYLLYMYVEEFGASGPTAASLRSCEPSWNWQSASFPAVTDLQSPLWDLFWGRGRPSKATWRCKKAFYWTGPPLTQTLCQDYKICFGLTTKAAETAKMQVIQNKSISFDWQLTLSHWQKGPFHLHLEVLVF